jgi:uncharacterized protein YcaQ
VSPSASPTVRRFVLGRQGLWPARRWKGRTAVDPALRYITSVQVDSLNVIGHSHDLVLWGRIDGYRAEDLQAALYRRRTAFEWGGNVQIRPVAELPYLRVLMDRKVQEKRWRAFAKSKAALIREVLLRIEKAGPLGGRDFKGPSAASTASYRGGKETTQVLYYLWLRGDVMVAARRGGEKLYDLTSRLFPREAEEVPVLEAEEHQVLQTLRHLGCASGPEWLRHAHNRIGRSSLRQDWKAWTQRWSDAGYIAAVEFPGVTGPRFLVGDAVEDLETVTAGGVPEGWKASAATTDEEAVFLSPLEITTSSGRAAPLFDFEYLWEVYKPPSQRRWGYYTLPILFGDALVARIDMRFDRPLGQIRVLGFWPEDPALQNDLRFAEALGRALARLGGFHGATDLDLGGMRSPTLEPPIRRAYRRASDRA